MTSPQDHHPEAVEELAREGYEACHPDDSFDDLKRRASFSKQDRCLLRDWLAAAERLAAAVVREEGGVSLRVSRPPASSPAPRRAAERDP